MDQRLPTHIEVSGLIRAVQAAGGFATVLHKGERDAGTLLIVATHNTQNTRLYERMPQIDGARIFTLNAQDISNKPLEFNEYLARRKSHDPDVWIVELDIADAERFIAVQHK